MLEFSPSLAFHQSFIFLNPQLQLAVLFLQVSESAALLLSNGEGSLVICLDFFELFLLFPETIVALREVLLQDIVFFLFLGESKPEGFELFLSFSEGFLMLVVNLLVRLPFF